MQKIVWVMAFGAFALSSAAQADVLIMPEADSAVETTPAPQADYAEAASAVDTEPAAPEPEAPADMGTPAAKPALHMPEKGQKMEAVLKQFGEPKIRHKSAGGDSPRHPAIMRWDYENFSVFFERGKVIDSVNHSKPAELHHADELKPLEY